MCRVCGFKVLRAPVVGFTGGDRPNVSRLAYIRPTSDQEPGTARIEIAALISWPGREREGKCSAYANGKAVLWSQEFSEAKQRLRSDATNSPTRNQGDSKPTVLLFVYARSR